MISEKTSDQPCVSCGSNKKGRLQRIIEGWGNWIFPNEEVENIAKYRALRCAACDFNKDMLDSSLPEILKPKGIVISACTKCYCPIAQKTRSIDETCPINRW